MAIEFDEVAARYAEMFLSEEGAEFRTACMNEVASLRARLDAMEGLCREARDWMPKNEESLRWEGDEKKPLRWGSRDWLARYDALAGETKP